MEEKIITLSNFGGALLSMVAAFLYSWGGRDGTSKVFRRFLAPIIVFAALLLVASVGYGLTKELLTCVILASMLLCLGYCMGYGVSNGGNTTLGKLKKRGLIAFVYILAGLPLTILSGFLDIFIVHIYLCLSTIFIGIKNPIPAANEEFLIGLFSQMMLLYMVV